MQIVDTNIVLRYILGDHADLSARAKKIFDENIVEIPAEVLCEVVFVLSSVYKVSRKEINTRLKTFFTETQCELPRRNALLKGLEIFAEKNLGFVDCILIGYKECENATIHTFDKALQKTLQSNNK
jgi:predicted nucleic-acid-binding protein